MELFPSVADTFLTTRAKQLWESENAVRLEEEERKRREMEEEFYRQKKEYESLSPEEKAKRLEFGLYNFKWTTYFEEQEENLKSDKTPKQNCV
jgi:hypothetical protein